MSHIFISYSRKDVDFAKRIVQALKENSLDVWIDWMSIWKGEEWEPAIYRGIEEADAFLFLISSDSVTSKPCNEEITHALKNNKLIIPLVIRDTERNIIREELSKLNWIFCRYKLGKPEVTVDNFITAIDEIRKTILTDYKWLQYQTKLQLKALDWDKQKDNSKLLRGKNLQEAEQQLASVGGKKVPQPTDLQRRYALASRKDEKRRRRQTTVGLTIGFVVMTALCIVAVASSFMANSRENARATAQAIAEEQANIALARQLAAQAQSLSLEQGDTAILSGLLAVEATKRYPEIDSDQALRNFLSVAAAPISEMKFDDLILSVAFSPNGKSVAAASIDGTTRVWDEESGKEIIQLESDSSFVKFSPDGKWLVTIDCENSGSGLFGIKFCLKTVATIWDTNNWQKVSKMTHGDAVHSIAFSQDSKWVVSGGQDDTIAIWDTVTGKKLPYTIHMDKEIYNVSSVNFSPDGKLVASGGTVDSTAIVWDVASGRKIAETVHNGEVQFTSFSPDSKWIVSGGLSNNVIVWDAYTGDEISRFTINGFGYKGLFSPNGNLIAVQGTHQSSGLILIWNLQTGKEIIHTTGEYISFSSDSKYIFTGGPTAKVWDAETGTEIRRMVFDGNAMAFSSDGTHVAFANQEGTIYIKEFSINQEVSLMTHDDSVLSIDFSPTTQWIASASRDGTTRVWNTLTGKEISRVTVDGIVVDVDFSSDGKWIAQGACEGIEGFCPKPTVRIWDANTGEEIYNLNVDYALGAIKFVPDNKRIIIAGQHGNIELWDLSTNKVLKKYSPFIEFNENDPYPGSSVSFISVLDVDPKGRWIASGIYTSTQVWELNSGKEIYKSTEDGSIRSIAFSPSGNFIASTNILSIKIWNPENGNVVSSISLEPFTGASSLTFSPDEKWIAGKDETSIHIWEIATGREISRILQNSINSIDFSPDGKWIASGSNDNTVSIWLWRPEDLIAEACLRLPRNLTQEEWEQYIGEEPYKPTCANLPIPTE